MSGAESAVVSTGWDPDGFERAFPSTRADGLRPRSRMHAPLAELGPLGRVWDEGGAVTAELPARGASLADLAALARTVSGLVDAVVLREPAPVSGAEPAPSYAAAVLADIVPVVVVVSGRDRNRVALEGEVAALADGGATAILVDVAGASGGGVGDIAEDHLTALARRAGAVVAVAADPLRPREARRVRLLARAGAHVCVAAPVAAGERSAFAREVAEEGGPRLVVDASSPHPVTLDTAALPGFAGFHVPAPADPAMLVTAARRAREVLS
ncbi:hypothetical protein [Microbacterium sp. 10M-3C3]|jgi:hypothetical protein|uniref:hypothetical protein n=1 Tax=Microbacterium sp. 10M-3C3 TaxID=2483401 RepID=UPI000F63CEB5|nr:hypothetical protein [Microbacterium sp. 10M-3C3]